MWGAYARTERERVMVTHIIPLQNVKGGVTKTTTAINLAAGLAISGRRVLLMDLDPQSNATYTLLGMLSDQQEGTLFQVVTASTPLADIVQPTKVERLFIAPGTLALSDADMMLSSKHGREFILRNALERFLPTANLDYIILDTPPNLNLLSVNALTACTGYIVPIALTLYATLGLTLLTRTVQDLEQNLRIQIPCIGALAALMDNTNESKSRLQDVQAYFQEKMFHSIIPRNTDVDKANDQQILYFASPRSAGSIAYARFVEEVIRRVEK
jgi:chromosome partitioning protein